MATPQNLGLGDMQAILSGNSTAANATIIAAQKNIIPKMTTTTRNALTGGSLFAGLTVYNTTTNKLNVYNGTAWEAVTSA